MVFSSLVFLLFFLPLICLIYFVIPSRFRGMRNFVLLGFSLFFYYWGTGKLFFLMVLSISINYLCGLAAGCRNKFASRAGVIAAVALNLGLLGWFKYAGFFGEIMGSFGIHLPIPEIVLPIGISFFTFQGLSYVIDVHRGDAQMQKNPLNVALYIALFPQLVAGPIVRYTTVMDEISNRRETLEDVSDGIVRFCFGLAKKMIIANAMAQAADAVFCQNAGDLDPGLAWLGALAYTFQIYFDFSAYSDMAIGLGKIFGFHFLENFNYPYNSRSVTEFWRRWHISLSTWFRDYLYIPLGGNRCSTVRHVRNILIVWLLTGLWHGAAWNFVLWGLWFALLLLGEKYLWGGALKAIPQPLQRIYTMLAVVFSWVMFRCTGIEHTFQYLGAMFGSTTGLAQDGQVTYYLLQYLPEWILAAFGCMPVKELAAQHLRSKGRIGELLICWGSRVLAAVLLLISYTELVTGSFNPFIYFQF